jgi:hypothetical protein
MRPGVLVVLALATLALSAACAHKVVAGQVWTLWGTVADFNADELSISHKSGRIVRLQIDSGTVFTNEEHPAGPEALAKAARVAVDVEVLPGGGQRAKAVRIVWGGAAPLSHQGVAR